jgi:hypothetical protein
VLEDFGDEDNIYFYFTPSWQSDLLVRQKEIYDGATPSGNSTMARNLYYLSIAFDEPAWRDRALAMLGGLEAQMARYPTSFGNWAAVWQLFTYGSWELVALGPNAIAVFKPIARTFLPNKVVHCATHADDRLPLLKGKPVDGETRIYLCRQYVCLPPLAEAGAWLKDIGNEQVVEKSRVIGKKINGTT